MEITTLGINRAKNVFQVPGVDSRGNAVLRKQLRRNQVAPFFANIPHCLIGMEACGSAHYWAHKIEALGHTVKLMAPQFVKPYVNIQQVDTILGKCMGCVRGHARLLVERISQIRRPQHALWPTPNLPFGLAEEVLIIEAEHQCGHGGDVAIVTHPHAHARSCM